MAAGDLTGSVTSTPSLPCAVFDGVDDYIEIPHNVKHLGENLLNGFTISAWIKPRSMGESANGFILDKSSGLTALTGINFRVRDVARVEIRVTSTAMQSAASSLTLNTLQHVLTTVPNGSNAAIYINNIASGTPTTLTTFPTEVTTTNAVRIGNRSQATDRTFDGSIAKVKMWNRVLTAAEITADYEGKIVSDGLIMNYELNGNAEDSSQFANDGTVSGAFFTNVDFNNIIADCRERNLAATTDKLLIVPISGRNAQVAVISANREA